MIRELFVQISTALLRFRIILYKALQDVALAKPVVSQNVRLQSKQYADSRGPAEFEACHGRDCRKNESGKQSSKKTYQLI